MAMRAKVVAGRSSKYLEEALYRRLLREGSSAAAVRVALESFLKSRKRVSKWEVNVALRHLRSRSRFRPVLKDKTLLQNSKKHSHTGMEISLLKTAGSNIPGANKPGFSELQPIGSGAQDVILSCNSSQTQLTRFPSNHCIKAASPTSPHPSEPGEVHLTSWKTENKHNECTKGNKDLSPMTCEVNYPKYYNGSVDKVECGDVSNLSAEEDANHPNLKSSRDGSVIFTESSIVNSMIGQASYQGSAEGKGHLENDMHSIANSITIEKENLIPQDQTAGLSKHVKSEKLDLETVEFLGEKVFTLCLNEIKDKDLNSGGHLSTCPADTLTQQKFNLLPNLSSPRIKSCSHGNTVLRFD